jgi:DNA-binding transcriptional LysR family regulator
VLTSLVEEGLGFTVLPPSAIQQEIQTGRLETAMLAKPAITRELILAAPLNHTPSIASAAISAVLVAEIAALAAEGRWAIRLTAGQDTA